MKRRALARCIAGLPLLAATAAVAGLGAAPGSWRRYELHYEVDLAAPDGAARLWLPVPQDQPEYQQLLGLGWQAGFAEVALHWDPVYRAPVLAASWDGAARPRQLRVTAHVAVRDRGIRHPGRRTDPATAALYLEPTANMPTDGIVAATASRIVGGRDTAVDKARAIYEWIVDNTFRDPKVVGCGTGDIRTMLETGYLGGKCADINSLFVGLARACGVPAREVYGVRAGESALFKSLGKGGGDVSGAQHCRAEFFSAAHGWIPVDPADVRKAVLEEGLALGDPRMRSLRERLFGSWEMNWIAFNSARDFALVPAAREPLPYFLYPYAEIGEQVLDGRDPAAFRYRIRSTERHA